MTNWSWAFGDGATGSGVSPVHAYALAGTYQVTLTVTDDQGAPNSVTHPVTATAPPMNQPPVAAFTFSCTALNCSFDGTGSTDDQGVQAWAWNFGDTTAGTSSTTSHRFATAGTYQVQLTVTDSDSATNSVIHAVAVSGPVNQPPTAAFTSTCTQLSCSLSGSGSSDDGTVTSWSWTFGDTTSGSGVAPQHAYAAAGTYSVTLTVTDDQGVQSAPVTHQVTVTAPAGPFVSDTFNRTVTNGLGTADVGSAWSTVGSATSFSVAPGAAAFRLGTVGSQLTGYLPAALRTDTDVLAAVALDKVPVGGPVYVTVHGRRVGSGNEYDAKVLVNADQSVTVRVTRVVGGVETALAGPIKVTGITYAAAMVLNVRLQVTGTSPTLVRARVWAATGTEPATWQVSGMDSTNALQVAGAVGLTMYLSSAATNAPVIARLSKVTAKPTAA